MMRDDFAVMILTHGRADRVYTMKSLRKGGYTGKVFLVIDNEDEQHDEYVKRYGQEHVVVFDKEAQMRKCDTMDTFGKKGVILFARNACFEIARELGLRYFLELDDDYTAFDMRFPREEKLSAKPCRDLDRLFTAMVGFLEDSDALTVALSQGGDYIGGLNGKYYGKMLTRKAMNTFFCRTDRPIGFIGTINEDVNTYTTMGSRGERIFSVTQAAIVQKETQQNAGGMTGVYLDNGTYLKSFYTVMTMPSCVSIAMMGSSHRRIHHNVSWVNCVPMILNEKYRKT
ncbi:MAG: hypothetical protein ACI4WX_14870 [Aristaeellaceae bacterium]